MLSGDPITMETGANLSSPLFTGDLSAGLSLGWTYRTDGMVQKTIDGRPIDFNKDGLADVVVTGQVNEVIGYAGTTPILAGSRQSFANALLGSPSGSLTRPAVSPISILGSYPDGYPSDGGDVLGVFDANRDGYDDLLYLEATRSSGSGTPATSVVNVRAWDPLRNGFATTAVATGTINTFTRQGGLAVFADVNGDSVPDMILPQLDGSQLANPRALHPLIGFQVFLGEAGSLGHFEGKFQADAWATVALRTPVANWGLDFSASMFNQHAQAVAADLNGDGLADLAIPEADGMTVFPNPGDGRFAQADGVFVAVASGGHAGSSLRAGDVDNDGDIDIVQSPNWASESYWSPPDQSYRRYWQATAAPITVYVNATPQGGAVAFTADPVGGLVGAKNGQVELADLDNDGDLDLVVADADPETTSYGVMTNDGTGGFGQLQVFTAFNDNDGFVGEFRRGIRRLAVVDTNGDGLADVATFGGEYGGYVTDTSDRHQKSNTAVDIAGVSLNRTYTAPQVVTPTQPPAQNGQPYSTQLTGSGGKPNEPFRFTLHPGSGGLPPGLVLSPTGAITGTPTQPGTYQFVVDTSQASGARGSTTVTLQVTAVPRLTSSPIIVAGSQIGAPVRILNTDGTLVAEIDAFFGYRSRVGVAAGDVNGDGQADVLATIGGKRATTEIRVFDGATNAEISTFAPYGIAHRGGAHVAVGDVLPGAAGNEIVVSPIRGKQPIRVFDAAGNVLSEFFPIGRHRGAGPAIAVANIDARPGDEIVTAFGRHRSVVRWYDGRGIEQGAFRGFGDRIAVGDVDGDGRADVVMTVGRGSKPIVRVYDPSSGTVTRTFGGFSPRYRGGLQMALVPRADGSRYDVVTALDAKHPTDVVIHDGLSGSIIDSFLAYPSNMRFALTVAAS